MSFNFTQKQVVAAISKIDSKKLRADVQDACVRVVGHAMLHGSSPLAQTLADRMDMNPVLRKLSPMVTAWLVKEGPFVYAKATGWQFSKAKAAKLNEDGFDYDEFVASCTQWDEQDKVAPKAVPFDCFKEVEKLVAKAAKKAEQGQCLSADMIEFLRAAMGSYSGRKAVADAAASSELTVAQRMAAEILAAEAGANIELVIG